MKKLYRKVLSILLVTVLMLSSSFTHVFAYESQNMSEQGAVDAIGTEDTKQVICDDDFDESTMIEIVKEMNEMAVVNTDEIIREVNELGAEKYIVPFEIEINAMSINLLSLADAMEQDKDVSELNIVGNIMTFKLFDNINVKVTESISADGTLNLEIIEDGKVSDLAFDSINNQVMLDGAVLEISMKGEYVFEQEVLGSSTRTSDWIWYGVIYPNVTAEQAIRLLPLTTLSTLLLGTLGWTGTLISICQNIVTALGTYNTKTLYCIRNIYRPSTGGYYALQYCDALYADSSHNTHLYTRTWIQYE